MITNSIHREVSVEQKASRESVFVHAHSSLSLGLPLSLVLRSFIIGIATCVLCEMASGERIPLKQPEITIDIGDTSKDWEHYDFDKKKYVFQDSRATVRRDAQTGDFFVDYYGPKGEKKYTAVWTPMSQFVLTVESNVTVSDSGKGFHYNYTLLNAEDSLQAARRFILCGTPLPEAFDLPSAKWRFLRIWKGSGDFICLRPDGDALRGVEPGETLQGFSFLSPLLPAVLAVKAIGYGERFLRDYSPYEEVPYSIERAFTPYLMTNDCVSGKTVGPGKSTVQITALRAYFDASIEQGWLEDGPYRDKLKAALDVLLSQHEAGKTDAVLEGLKNVQEMVENVYRRKNSPMLSEAYALLHFNAEYLLKHYKEEVEEAQADGDKGAK